MGRKVDLLVMLRNRITKLRRLEYFVQNHNLNDEDVESVVEFLEDVLSDDLLDIILMDLKEAKCIEDWPMVKLRALARKLKIRYWSKMSKDELISQIRYHEIHVMLYFPNFIVDESDLVEEESKEIKDGKRSPRSHAKTRKRKRRRNKIGIEEIRAKISESFKHGSSFGRV